MLRSLGSGLGSLSSLFGQGAPAPAAEPRAAEPDKVPLVDDDDQRLLALLSDLPGDGRAALLECLGPVRTELASIHASYSVAAAGDNRSAGRVMPLAGWMQLCADAKVRLNQARLKRIFEGRATPSADDDTIYDDDAPPSHIDMPCFLERVVRLAVVLSGDPADGSGLPAVLAALLHECLMPFARRDTSSAFNKVLGVKPVLRPFLEQTKAAFSGNGALERAPLLQLADTQPLQQVSWCATPPAQVSPGKTGSRSGRRSTPRGCQGSPNASERSSACSPKTSASCSASSASMPSCLVCAP